MGALGRIGVATPPPPAVMRLLGRYSREELAMFVTVAIDLIDLAGPDTDREPNGDELDGTAGEDDFYPHSNWLGEPGSPVSDPPEEDDHGGCEHDGREPEEGVIVYPDSDELAGALQNGQK